MKKLSIIVLLTSCSLCFAAQWKTPKSSAEPYAHAQFESDLHKINYLLEQRKDLKAKLTNPKYRFPQQQEAIRKQIDAIDRELKGLGITV